MKISRYIVPLMLMFALPAMAMTDQQVVNYIKTQSAAGKSQKEIGSELLAKGVTPEQIQRIKAQYEDADELPSTSTVESTGGGSRMRMQPAATNVVVVNGASSEEKRDKGNKRIYGHDIFDSRDLSFEPNTNIATPQNYRLGPGDEVIIDIWGASEDNIRKEISPDGSIMISQIGPVFLNGMTVAEANRHVKNIFSKKYAGVGSETDINLTLGNIRSIQVDVMGEVTTPGSFRLSPFSNVFHAIYSAGGINGIASLRNIHVMRNGKRVANTDLYDYLFKGSQKGNIRLQEGDIIIVPPYTELVNIQGNVKRPMYYELKPEESLSKLIEYAGGFTGDAYSDVVRLQRQNGFENELYTIEKSQYPSYTLQDGDVVTIGEVVDRYSNKVEVRGAVKRPGQYAINSKIKTVKDLIKTAEGLDENAYLDRALIYREMPDRTLEILSVNLRDLMNGTTADIKLNKNDIITIETINEILRKGDVTITGYVNRPGSFRYADGVTVKDLVLQAGGLREGASTANVEVARRIIDPEATDATTQLAQVFKFSIGSDMTPDNGNDFELKPYDVVHIRKSPTYTAQQQVSIEGEVLFPGSYVLQSRNERISDVIKRAGGILESGYVKGAYLHRRMSEEQLMQAREAYKRAKIDALEGDSTSFMEMQVTGISNMYNVGIDLQQAVDNPGSDADFVLQEGDVLTVPENQSTVAIAGQVLYPNSVVFVPGKKAKYYIEQAGGYTEDAKKKDAYVVYMNGTVAKAKGSTPIEPGCRLVVPAKNKKDKMDWAKILSITGTITSIATVTASVIAATR